MSVVNFLRAAASATASAFKAATLVFDAYVDFMVAVTVNPVLAAKVDAAVVVLIPAATV